MASQSAAHDRPYLSHQALKEPAGLKDSSSSIASIVNMVEVPQKTEGNYVKDGADGSDYEPAESCPQLDKMATRVDSFATYKTYSTASTHTTDVGKSDHLAIMMSLVQLTCRLPGIWHSISWAASRTLDPWCPCNSPVNLAISQRQLAGHFCWLLLALSQ